LNEIRDVISTFHLYTIGNDGAEEELHMTWHRRTNIGTYSQSMDVLYFKTEDPTSKTLLLVFCDALVIRLIHSCLAPSQGANDAVTRSRCKLHPTQRVWSLNSNASHYNFATLDRGMIVDRSSLLL
jgi:hypothetical protein